MSWQDYKQFKETGTYTPGGSLMPGLSSGASLLDPAAVERRREQLRKTFAFSEEVASRFAPRFVRAMHTQLVTGAPVMASNIHAREVAGAPGEEDFSYEPYPGLVFVPYFIANSLQRFFGRPDLLSVAMKKLRAKLLPETGALPFIEIDDVTYEMPDFEALPPCRIPGKTMVAAYVDGKFYWLTVRDAGDAAADWLKDAILGIEAFPQIKGVFFPEA